MIDDHQPVRDDYQQFLKAKTRNVAPAGIIVDSDELHHDLFPHQRHIVAWALERGRAAIFADTGLGKTFMQVEWATKIADITLIVAPLSVARQTVRETRQWGYDITYVRTGQDVTGPGIWITNYEMVDKFDPSTFDAIVLDESSILKNHTGTTRTKLIEQWADTKYRLCCTATPAPNDVTELTNHAEFLGVMPRNEMLAAYFIHDNDGWRLKGHAVGPMYRWMASWAIAIRRPSDLGYDDSTYELPPLTIEAAVVRVEQSPEGQLFATELGGVGGRHKVRRHTLDARVARAAAIANRSGQWIVWCGLNQEAEDVADAVAGAVNVPGAWTPDQKAEALEQFQDGTIRVLVTKPAIAGFGMNFQNAHQMIFLGLSDSYESYYQAIRRCYRFGQTEPVQVYIVVSELEQQIVQNVRAKESEAATMTANLIETMTNAPTRKMVT